MSDATCRIATRMRSDIDARAAAWLERRDRERLERRTIRPSSMHGSRNRRRIASPIWRLEAAWSRTDRLAALAPCHAGSAGAAPRTHWPLLSQDRRRSCGCRGARRGGRAYFSARRSERTIPTPVGGHEIVTLRRWHADRTQHRHGLARAHDDRSAHRLARQGRGLFPGQARCGPSLHRDGGRSSRHRSGHEIPRAPRCRQAGSGRDAGPRAVRCGRCASARRNPRC